MNGKPAGIARPSATWYGHGAPHFQVRHENPPDVVPAADRADELALLRRELAASQNLVTDLIESIETLRHREAELHGRIVELHAEMAARDEKMRQMFDHVLKHRNELQERLLSFRRSLPGRLFYAIRKVLTLGKK